MERAEHILQELPCGCAIFDAAGAFTFLNRTFCGLVELPCDAILGKNIETVLTIASRIFFQTHFFPLLNLKGEVSEIFLTLKARSGTHVPVMVNAKKSIENGQSVYTCVFSPVWERQKYEEQLLTARNAQQKALEENAALNELRAQLEINQHELDRKLSILRERNEENLQMGKVFMHDMQEPVRKIGFFVDALFDKINGQLSSEDQRKITVIQKSVQRLKHMTSSLLDIVQINTVDEPIALLDTATLIREAFNEVVGDGQDNEITLELGELPEFEGRQEQIKIVFSELIKNALQNPYPGRPLHIQVSAVLTQENAYQHHADKYRYTDHVRIEIKDNGSGFDGQYNAYVFGLFNKIDARSPRLGLGLALCKQIISNHYGTIKAQSEAEKGTCVTIVLPLQQTLG